MDDSPERTFVPLSPSDEYVQYTGDVALADETFLQPSKVALIPLISPCILTNFIDIQRPSVAWNRPLAFGAFMGSQSTGLFAYLAQFNTRCEIGVVCGTNYFFDWRATCVCCMAYSIIESTTEVSRKRAREKRSVDVLEETAEVVVGGPKLYGTSKRDVLKGCRGLIGLILFVVDPDMLKRKAWCTGCFGIWAWPDEMGYSQYWSLLAFGIPNSSLIHLSDCRWCWLEKHVQAVLKAVLPNPLMVRSSL